MNLTTLYDQQQALMSKAISSVELTKISLEKIQKSQQTLNSFITVCDKSALTVAKIADEKRQLGNNNPLLGIPMAHKDIFCTKDIKTSCGSKMLDNFYPPYESTVSQKINDAGMVMVGKTNMDEFAMGSSNETSFYGPCKNPWHLDKVPGGSSGGSAACVAAGLTTIATGTDTGGSIRQPASLCGITGLKPTYGRISRWGMIAYASSLDQAGVFAKTSQDIALVLNAIAGFDKMDSTSSKTPIEDYTLKLDEPLKGKTIGLPKAFFNEHLDPTVMDKIMAAKAVYESLGAKVIDVDLANMHLAIPCYYIIAPAECASNLARFDGIRFGHQSNKGETLTDFYCHNRSEGFGLEVKRRILTGNYVLSSGFYDAYYIKAQKIRRLILNDFENAFNQVDFLLGPTTPTTAFDLGQRLSPSETYLADIYTTAINLAGLPGLTHPAGFIDDLPIGAQLIAPAFQESLLLNAAHQFQKVTDYHLKTPKGFTHD